MSRGFIQIRRGIEEHLIAGRIGLFELGVYVLIHLQADFETGIWTGSAPRILGCAPRGTALRDVQRALARLEEIGFIRSFHQQGQRGNYRVMIHKYEPQSGALMGRRLNALESTTWECPMYVQHTDAALRGRRPDGEDAPYLKEQEQQKTRKKKKNPAAEPATPADARHRTFVDFAYAEFEQRRGQKPTWGGKDFKALSMMLASNKALGIEELKRRFRNFLDSTEPFTRKQGGSLAYFCTHVDSFLGGPILDTPHKGGKPNGGTNGKLVGEELEAYNLRAANFLDSEPEYAPEPKPVN